MSTDYPKSVFTYRFEDETENPRPATAARWAAALAARTGAHLEALVAVPHRAVPNMFGASLVKNVVGRDNEVQDKAAAAIAQALRSETQAAGVSSEVQILSAPFTDVREQVATLARLHDLVVTDASSDSTTMQRELLTDVLFGASRPVVVVPTSATTLSLDTIVVGWDGTAPAARALHDAVPLLRQAGRVDVVSVVNDKTLPEGAHAKDIVPLLARHGVKATAHELEGGNGHAAQVLLHHATSNQAGLLVIGAYAHSRLRQLVFGGFTSALLKDCPVPLMLSH